MTDDTTTLSTKQQHDDDDDDRYQDWFQSVRSSTGLEIGVRVTWPGLAPFELSTCLSEDAMAPMFHGTQLFHVFISQWAGTRVWRAAVVALQYLCSEDCPYKFTSNTVVVELGCGLGVPGILLGLLTKCRVVLTDMQSLTNQLQRNIDKLLRETQQQQRIEAATLDWSKAGVQALAESTKIERFDVVVNCDCIYEPLYDDSWKQLLACQEEFLRRNPQTYMLTSVERRRADGIDLYLEAARQSPCIDRVESVQLQFEHPTEVEIYRIYAKQNNN